MYGLVNNAIRSMVLDELGPVGWASIRRQAGVELEDFQALESYEDAVTYQLVGAASEVLGLPADDLLRAFGRYWITYTGSQGYGPMLGAAGDNLGEFLGNLDALHANMTLSFPELRPPSFESIEQPDGSIRLEYYSEREGLGPMVEGLVEGLAERFGETIHIRWVTRRETAGHDGFEIQREPQAQPHPDAA